MRSAPARRGLENFDSRKTATSDLFDDSLRGRRLPACSAITGLEETGVIQRAFFTMVDSIDSYGDVPDYNARIGFGGGCHWCTEAVFASLSGVHRVQQGFICSHPPNDQYSEAVLVDFAERHIPVEILVEIHLRTHASTAAHSMRDKYRSAIYVKDRVMENRCCAAIKTLQNQFEKPLLTQVLRLAGFTLSADRYRKYYESNPDKPFCATYIEPKLELLERDFRSYINPRKQ